MLPPGAVNATVKDTDNGARKLIETLEKEGRKDVAITVGIHDDEDGEVIEKAAHVEFGTDDGRIPPRPAISGWADENKGTAVKEMRDQYAAALKAGTSPIQRMDQLAQKFAGQVQAKIADGVPPPNAQSTIDQKGSDKPWIDSGQTRQAIRGKVDV